MSKHILIKDQDLSKEFLTEKSKLQIEKGERLTDENFLEYVMRGYKKWMHSKKNTSTI